MVEKSDAVTTCKELFPLSDPAIPQAYKDEFLSLGGRAGEKEVVDSCDLDQFYRYEENFPETWRLTKKEDFFSNGSFHYPTFYAHIRRCRASDKLFRMQEFLSRISKSEKKSEGVDLIKFNRNYEELLDLIPSPLSESAPLKAELAQLQRNYPYSTFFPEKNLRDKGVLILGGSSDTYLISAMTVAVPAINFKVLQVFSERGTYLTLNSDLSAMTVRYFSAKGQELWHIKIDISEITRVENNFLGIRRFETLGVEMFNGGKFPVETNINEVSWKNFSEKSDIGGILRDAFGKEIEKAISSR